jgi:hypothetical protein
MLLFELFPAFIAVVSVIVGVWLYVTERRARAEGVDDAGPVGSRPDHTPDQAAHRPSTRRPSMRE